MFPSLQPISTNPLDSDLSNQIVHFYCECKALVPYILPRVKWFHCATVDVYVRCSKRHIQGFYIRTLEVANITVHKKRQGIYDALLSLLWATIQPGEALFVENVLDPGHYSIYINRGFARYNPQNGVDASFYRVKQPAD